MSAYTLEHVSGTTGIPASFAIMRRDADCRMRSVLLNATNEEFALFRRALDRGADETEAVRAALRPRTSESEADDA